MRVFFVACCLAMAMSTVTLAQDKTREVVGSDAKVVLKTTKTMIDQPLTYPQSGKPEITMMVLTMQPDGHTSLHKHPSPTVGYVMEGFVEVRAENVVLKVKAGEGFLEPIEGLMQIWNTNSAVSKLAIFVAGSEGTPVSAPIK
jgi:quercetin dioxygenase-like cupin family protein